MYNKVTLVGNLGKDPQVNALESGVKVANFTLATSKSYKDKNSGEKITKTEWHNIVLWRGLAEVAEKFLKKGSQILVEGELQTRSYEDKDGNTRYITEIVGQTMNMMGSKSGSESAPAASAEAKVQDYEKTPAPEQPAAPAVSTEEEDDLPF